MWEKALKNTEIIRARVKSLMTKIDTNVPYILLSESSVNIGDTIVRKGEVVIAKPALIMPPYSSFFSGFEFDEKENLGQDALINFLLVRGISLPSLKYDNKTNSLDIHEGALSSAVKYYKEELNMKEDVTSGLLVGPEDCWQLSLLIFICTQISRNAENDINKLLEDFHKRKK